MTQRERMLRAALDFAAGSFEWIESEGTLDEAIVISRNAARAMRELLKQTDEREISVEIPTCPLR